MFTLASMVLVAALSPAPNDNSNGRPASCTVENQPAAIREAFGAEYPATLVSQRVRGTTAVRVDLASTGALIKASVYKSSGYAVLDEAAVRSAHFVTYSPETVSCQHVGGSYVVDVEFDPDQR